MKPGRSRLAVTYKPAAAGLGAVELRHPELRVAFGLAAPARILATLFARVTEELDPYSRRLGRNPDSTETLAAAALMPIDFLPSTNPAFRKLQRWATTELRSDMSVLTSVNPLLDLWDASSPVKLSRSDSVQLANLLGRLEIGIEPDPRFGGPSLVADQQIVLFRNEVGAPGVSSPEYGAAATLVHLAAAVSQSDGDVTKDEIDVLGAHLEHALHLMPAERTRLHAHLTWLSATDVRLTGLKKRFATIDLAARQAVGDMLVTIASADGVVSPAEVQTLGRIYTLLGLNPASVTSHLHGAITSGHSSSGRGPVVVRPSAPPEVGCAIPARPERQQGRSTPHFILDSASIQQKLAETAAVSALLGNIFVDEIAPPPTTSPLVASKFVPIAHLDQHHSGFFHQLMTKSEWARHEFEALAEQHTLMPNGAIDHLNEAAYDIAGEPLLEGDDPITINNYAREEMTA